jgi:hypothetical protein
MKKAILTIGLFTIVTALTSFATPTRSNSEQVLNSEIDGGHGGQDTGGSKKVDIINNNSSSIYNKSDIDGGHGGQDTGGSKKVD